MLETGESLSRRKARAIAKFIRGLLGINELYVDVPRMLEKMARDFPDFNYEIVDDEELSESVYGTFTPNNETNQPVVIIPNRVYVAACGNGSTSGRDRMTIVHEIAHYFLMIRFKYKPIESLGRGRPSKSKDPEWQAMAVAGEILMPFEETEPIKDPYELATRCGVSFDAAYYRIHKYVKSKQKS
jgi:Zn-dependent peptidase ImmA (M78 family)